MTEWVWYVILFITSSASNFPEYTLLSVCYHGNPFHTYSIEKIQVLHNTSSRLVWTIVLNSI